MCCLEGQEARSSGYPGSTREPISPCGPQPHPPRLLPQSWPTTNISFYSTSSISTARGWQVGSAFSPPPCLCLCFYRSQRASLDGTARGMSPESDSQVASQPASQTSQARLGQARPWLHHCLCRFASRPLAMKPVQNGAALRQVDVPSTPPSMFDSTMIQYGRLRPGLRLFACLWLAVSCSNPSHLFVLLRACTTEYFLHAFHVQPHHPSAWNCYRPPREGDISEDPTSHLRMPMLRIHACLQSKRRGRSFSILVWLHLPGPHLSALESSFFFFFPPLFLCLGPPPSSPSALVVFFFVHLVLCRHSVWRLEYNLSRLSWPEQETLMPHIPRAQHLYGIFLPN
ncbi:hypothetical protein BD289DRAFT_48528 [Coniella lustricola]|uniref:Uncharacterized protein n=1 Tax=Coniella lustricola TaxID=2025994 RepID=A0A2T3AIH8_9PEZI|nr:hypothetical protein BD289DRAFT_48528 [Coniella lustricola]